MILASNIVNAANTQCVAEETLTILKQCLELSLGPYGSTTIIQDPTSGHIMTKDGFSILDRIRFNEPVSATFLNIIKEVSLKLVQTVGDGSTSSIIAAYYFYESLHSFINANKMRPQQIINLLDRCVNDIEGELKSYKRLISDDLKEIKDLAAVSLNNDEETGAIISEIYKSVGLEGFINIQLGSEYKTTYKQIPGFQFRAGYLDPMLINNDTEECELNNVAVLVFNSPINNDDAFKVLELAILHYMKAFPDKNCKYDSLLIIAPDYNEKCKSAFRGTIDMFKEAGMPSKINILRYNMNTEDRVAEIEDLVAATGARKVLLTSGEEMEILDPANPLTVDKFFGFSGKVVSNFKSSTFINNGDEKDATCLDIRKDSVRHQIKLAKEEGTLTLDKAYFLNKRLAVLEQKLVTIYVGGNSEQQRKSNKTLMEDAVAACRSAIKHGYVIGGNLSIPIVINKIMTRHNVMDSDTADFLFMIRKSFIEVYKNVLRNGINDTERVDTIVEKSIAEEKIYDLVRDNYTNEYIINSVETEIEILKNVVSIVSLIFTSNQFITQQVGAYSSREIEIIK